MANINMRIDDELKKEFYKAAEENAHTPSLLIRKWIAQYIKMNGKDEKKEQG